MAFSFNPLWKTLIDSDMTKEELREKIKISSATMAKMGKGEFVSLDVIHKICVLFDCQPDEIFEYLSENENSTHL